MPPPHRAAAASKWPAPASAQALDRSQPVLPRMPGRRTHDYIRHGVTSLFAAFNTQTGQVISELHRRHRAIEFKKFLTRKPTSLHPDQTRRRIHNSLSKYLTRTSDSGH